MMSWQMVETGMWVLFCEIVRPAHPRVAGAIFHSVHGLQPRFGMIVAGLEEVIQGTPFVARWEVIEKKFSKRLNDRNALAHFGPAADIEGSFAELKFGRSVYDMRKRGNRKKYGIEEIEGLNGSFTELGLDLLNFTTDLKAARGGSDT